MTNMHFSRRLYLIILLTEVKDMLIRCAISALSLWLSFLAKCKALNVIMLAGRCLSSMVNLIVAKQIYRTAELCHRYQRIFIYWFNNLIVAEI